MKQILTVFYLCVITLFTQAQNINGVSTNPQNPVNPPFLPWANTHLGSGFTHDPFLNRFDWRPIGPTGNLTDYIPVAYFTGFNIAGISLSNNQIPMLNPFNTGMSTGPSSYIDEILKPYVRDRDFWWEDGWELLYMNLGYTPSLQLNNLPDPANPLDIIGPSPTHAPYFVLYNRYKGTMRLFSNVWFNTTTANKPEKVIATLKFNNDFVNGLLRHNSSYDLALDQPTIIKNISGPSYNFENQFNWMMSDFQVGFDPCICNRTTNDTRLKFEFRTMQNMSIDMTSRSIAVNRTITDNSYLTDDFLNLNDIELVGPNAYKPGSRMYKEMGSMLDAYKAAQLQYEKDLANYNSIDGVLKRAALDILKDGITATGSMVGAGVAGSFFTNGPMKNFILRNKTRVGLFSGGLIDLDTNDADAFAKSVTGATKSIVASGFDFLSTTFDVPDKPIKPSPPTATFTETTYKGTITAQSSFESTKLLIPGSLPHSFTNGSPGINRLNYPAYNEVLGLFALLETPEVDVKAKYNKNMITSPREPVSEYWSDAFYNSEGRYYFKETTKSTDFKTYELKLSSPLKYRFNHAVRDFDFEKTKLYYSFRIKFKKHKPTNEMYDVGETYQPTLVNSSDFFMESYTENGIDYMVITTPFIDVKNILNEPFHADFEYLRTYLSSYYNGPGFITKGQQPEYNYLINEIQSIDLKLMVDMYFSSKGSKGQDLNTLQTFTYLIYQNSGSDNQMPVEQDQVFENATFLSQNKSLLKHQPGTTIFDNINFSPSIINQFQHSSLVGNEIHVWVENAEIKNKITVTPGYKAYIHFLNNLSINPESDIFPEVILDNAPSGNLYNYPQIYEATDEELSNFCNASNNKYKANIGLTKKENYSTDKHNEIIDINPIYEFKLSPNPASNLLYLNSQYDNFINIKILDISGKVVTTPLNNIMIENNHYGIDVSSLVNGIYFCNIQLSSGEQITKKFVIAK